MELYYNNVEGDLDLDIIKYIIDFSSSFIASGGVLFGMFLIILESFIPALPLSFFIMLNVNTFGFYTGIIISWIGTCIGCYISYLFFLFLEKKYLSKIVNNKLLLRINSNIKNFRKISFSELVLLITLPFTPAFLINILSGLVKMPQEKFLFAILIGKVFSVVFWGYIGKSFISSLTDIYSIIFIVIALVIAFIISKIINKKFRIE